MKMLALCAFSATFALAHSAPLRTVPRTVQQPASAGASTIVKPDVHWNDTDGNRIEAHAAGMLQAEDGRWFWYGESKKTSSLADHGVNCYSAPTIAGPWKNEGQVFHQSDIHMTGKAGPFIVERPKVLFNNATRTYVMWFHLDTAGYGFRHAGVAVSAKPAGPFTFVHGMQPDGIPSLDMSLFRDPLDGQGYFVRSCNNAYAGISRLTPDYLNSTGIISKHPVFEGMALFRLSNGTFYIITSHLTGWSPNPLMLFRAAGKTLDDPQWVSMGNPTASQTSFNTQPTFVITYTPKSGAPYFVYMGDDWEHCGGGLVGACYTWLPLQFESNSVSLKWRSQWDLEDPFAPPPPGPAPGPAPPPPTKGRLQLQPCNGTRVSWDYVGGALKLRGTSLCVDSDGSYVADCTGKPDQVYQLRPSHGPDGGGVAQYQLVQEGSGSVGSGGKCVDVTYCGTRLCPGYHADLSGCNTYHGNQQFTHNAATGELAMPIVPGMCLGAAQ